MRALQQFGAHGPDLIITTLAIIVELEDESRLDCCKIGSIASVIDRVTVDGSGWSVFAAYLHSACLDQTRAGEERRREPADCTREYVTSRVYLIRSRSRVYLNMAGDDMDIIEQHSSTPRLSRLEKLVGEMEQMAPSISPQLIDQLRESLTNLPFNLSAAEILQAWRLSYSIWNCCVTIANNLQPGQKLDEDHARLRQIASDLLLQAGNVDEIDSGHFKIASFFYRTGVIWHSLKKFELAAVCFEKVTELMSKAQEEQQERNPITPITRSKEEQELMFDLFLARSQTAWELSQKALASSLSARARNLLPVLPERNVQLAEHYFEFGQSLLSKEDTDSQIDAIKYLEQAFEITSTVILNYSSSGPEEPVAGRATISCLKIKILRYLAAGHLQRENYDSVLKCAVVLKSSGPKHPSTSYLLLKALAGLGRYEEAEKELFALVQDKAAIAAASMSGIEIVLQDPIDRSEAAKRAFLVLQARYPSDKSLPVRMLECLLRRLPRNGEASNKNFKAIEAALDIASNECVVATITGVNHGGTILLDNVNSVCKEQECIHALLWNRGSELFQDKQYQTCIKLFETSMLYLPRDLEGHLQRAKSLRVLCLCRLALEQYDRANEYVTEAEKNDPCIACAFLKFKIHLQTKNEAGAAEQVEKMTRCPDFESEYLTLASHEALTCNSIKIAISALSAYLDLPKEKHLARTRDVVVIRNIVCLALQDDQHHAVVKYLKEAQAQLANSGFDAFFGLGNVGQQEANWFAVTSWNEGLLAVKTSVWQLAGDYFSCAADFYGSLPESKDNLRCLQQSLLLATSALLTSTTGDECLRTASRMLDKCRKVQRALARSMDPTEIADNRCEVHLSLLSFDLKSRTKDFKSQIEMLHHCASLPGFETHYFLHMAQQAGKSPRVQNNEVISTAYRLALKSILNSTSQDYRLVALIVRKLITLADEHCKDGPEVMAVYIQAKEILAGLEPGEYPHEELQWLIATSWNRAGLHVKFLRFSTAEPWMQMALDLAAYDPHMENRKLSMIASLAEVRQSKQSSVAIAYGDLEHQ